MAMATATWTEELFASGVHLVYQITPKRCFWTCHVIESLNLFLDLLTRGNAFASQLD